MVIQKVFVESVSSLLKSIPSTCSAIKEWNQMYVTDNGINCDNLKCGRLFQNPHAGLFISLAFSGEVLNIGKMINVILMLEFEKQQKSADADIRNIPFPIQFFDLSIKKSNPVITLVFVE